MKSASLSVAIIWVRNAAHSGSVACLLLILGLLLSPVFAAGARSFHFERLSEAQGLARDSVTAIEQDGLGFMWIGSQAGLSRFDGLRVINFRHEANEPRSLADNWIQALLTDPAGSLWVGTRRGLQRFNPGGDDFETIKLPTVGRVGQGATQVNALLSDGRGGLWIGTDDGLLHFEPKSGAFRTFYRHASGRAQGLAHDKVQALALDGEGNLWVGTAGGVQILPAGASTFSSFEPAGQLLKFSLDLVKSLVVDRQGQLWVVSEAGAQAWRLSAGRRAQQLVHAHARKSNEGFIALLVDRQGALWLGTGTDGLWQWQAEEMQFRQYAHRANDAFSVPQHISYMFHDRSGSLWLGTWVSGVYRADLASGGFNKFGAAGTDNKGLTDQRVFSIAAQGPGKLWLSTTDAVALLDTRSGKAQQFQFGHTEQDSMNFADTRPSAADKPALDWLRRYMDGRSSQLRLPSFGADNPLGDVIRHVASDARGQLWLGSRSGLHRLDPVGGRKKTFRHDANQSDSLSDDNIKMVLPERDGDIWVATDQGLDRFNAAAENFSHFRYDSARPGSISSDRVQYLFQDSQARIWVGTAQGLNQLIKAADGQVSFKQFPDLPSLGADPIGGILEDGKGRLWVSTTAGISRFDPASRELRNYTAKDGMIESFYFANSAFQSADGQMYFGGLNGLTAFHPEDITDNPTAPPLQITEIRVNNEALRPGKTVQGLRLDGAIANLRDLQLKAGHNAISLELAALHYADPLRNRYAYQLQGFDADWVMPEPGQRKASYTNLAPGNYVFRAKAANKDGVWNEEGVTLALRVLPAYWQTWWFRLGGLGLFVGGLWALFYARVRVLKSQRLQLERQVAGRTAELLQEKQTLEQTRDLLLEQKLEVERQKDIVERAHGNISTLSEMGRHITASLDRELIQRSLLLHVQQLMPVDCFAIGFVNQAQRLLEFPFIVTAGNLELKPAEVLSLNASERAELRCVNGRQALLLTSGSEAAALERLVGPLADAARSAVLVPLQVGERVLGVVLVQSRRPHAYEPWQCDMLLTLAAYGAIALENSASFLLLKQTQEDLVQQQKFAALGSLVAGVAHELNTPLGNSLMVASTLMDKSQDFGQKLACQQGLRKSDLQAFVSETQDAAALLMRGLTRSADLVRSFKEVAVDRSSEQRRVFDLKHIVQEVADTLANEVRSKGHKLSLDIPAALEMDAYPGPLGQVLTNLITNSILHGFEGRRGGRMHISAEPVGPAALRIRFSDDGVGIPAENLERIFDPFFTTKMGQGGSGLGLSISYNLVHSILGGEISISSEAGAGAVFTIDLPRKAPLPGEAAEAPESA
ncbi:sensor histidine kinase [Roseateles albus]|uniref:histidine kinase n=1 Tax=Roseateles albus TaxID=2987525 RepID=A0ABT5KG82_9BURK|nr:two-component regulator propeller domain-containing protein [Roseateles albus]